MGFFISKKHDVIYYTYLVKHVFIAKCYFYGIVKLL